MRSTPSNVVPVRLFGSLAVGTGDGRVGPQDVGGAKPKQLLESLLLERGRLVGKDELADRLWAAEGAPVDTVATIETYVSVLRRRLPEGHQLIGTEPRGYRLAADLVAVDLDEFDRLAQLGAVGPPAERRPHLEAAVTLALEPVLSDEPYADWVLPIRNQYAERRLQALTELAECCLGISAYANAAEHAETALAVDPILERAGRAAMLGHYATGNRSAALRAFSVLRGQLAADLGVIPLPETLALHTAILRNEPLDSLLDQYFRPDHPVRFANHRGVKLAFQVVGERAPNILFAPPFVTHVGAIWDEPVYAGFMRRLAGLGRLVVFDKRGTGLSDPVTVWPTEEERGDDVGAVLDAADCSQAFLLGVCDGGALCARFAARHPERVAGLVLVGVPARWLASEDFKWGWSKDFHEAFASGLEDAWSSGQGTEFINPSVADDPRYRALYARCLRLGASPGASRMLAEFNRDDDVRPILPDIRVPTLVISRQGDPWVHVENSRYIASHVPGAELLELPGLDHEPWIGDSEPIFEALETFVSQSAGSPVPAPASTKR